MTARDFSTGRSGDREARAQILGFALPPAACRAWGPLVFASFFRVPDFLQRGQEARAVGVALRASSRSDVAVPPGAAARNQKNLAPLGSFGRALFVSPFRL